MKFHEIMTGQTYKTRLNGGMQAVTVVKVHEFVSHSTHFGKRVGKKMCEVTVRTGSGDIYYRTPEQLRKIS